MRIIFLIILYLLTGFAREEQQEQKTNLQIADSLTFLVLLDRLPEIQAKNIDSIAIDVSQLAPEKQNYLRILLGNWFFSHSFQVFRNYHQGMSFQGTVFEINQYELNIIYSKPYEKKFLGSDFVNREVSLELNGQFFAAADQRLEIIVNTKKVFTDEIPYAEIAGMENPGYSFARGKREDYSFWDKVYEPVLTLTSVAILVYLFFSQRS